MKQRLLVKVATVLVTAATAVVAHDYPATAKPNQAGTWSNLPSLPKPRQEHAVVALNNKIYIIGGVIPGACNPFFPVYCSTGTTDVYDVGTGTWSAIAPLPPLPDGSERTLLHPGAAVVKGKIYVLGGLQRPSPTSDFPWYAVGDSFVYDPLTDKWTPLAPMPPGTERGSGAIVAYEQKIYVAGGTFCHEGFEGQCFTDSERNHFFSVYDTVTNTWQQLPDLPQPRDHVPGAVLGNSLYLFGGRDDNVDSTFSDVFAYNLKTGTWRTRAPMPTARSEAWLGVVGEKVHLIGGSGNVANETGTFDDHEAYGPRFAARRVQSDVPSFRRRPPTVTGRGSSTPYPRCAAPSTATRWSPC